RAARAHVQGGQLARRQQYRPGLLGRRVGGGEGPRERASAQRAALAQLRPGRMGPRPVAAERTEQDEVALLIGDVAGGWQGTAAGAPTPEAEGGHARRIPAARREKQDAGRRGARDGAIGDRA